MQEQNNDFELIKKFLDGDESAFNRLVLKYQEKIYMLARRMTGNHLDADEVVQEVLMVLYKKLSTFEFKSAFYTWLYRITMTRSLNYIKRRSLKEFLPLSSLKTKVNEKNDPLISVENKEKIMKLEKILQKIPSKQREVFILRNFEQLDYDEISRITGTSVGALKANYFHALNKVKDMMKDYEKP
ncbi:RNA polymerase sigma factor [Ignavibacterium sp.]|jgi:RNA polymerase sigma-70 factor (ECF subfamily)|uniref:RNA polymerase sigma factor n=1 Tax=Ignavibacterium sp. TaxID=2651167 RepID=UPI0025C070D3|nr:RNA polymerase sigma factor [Ignavibacterium sp.]